MCGDVVPRTDDVIIVVAGAWVHERGKALAQESGVTFRTEFPSTEFNFYNVLIIY